MKLFLRTLAVLYLIGACLHVLDLLDLRLHFSEMNVAWKSWIFYLCIFDFIAAVGLWRQKRWGTVLFTMIALSQLVAYLGFQSFFGSQNFLVGFHVLTLAIFIFLFFRNRTAPPSPVKEAI